MEGIFRFILTSTFYGSIVGLAILLLKKLLNSKINATWHYLIWIVLIIKLLIPIGPESVVSFFYIVNKNQVIMENIAADEMNPILSDEESEASLENTNIPEIEPIIKAKKPIEEIVAYIWAVGVVSIGGWFVISYYIFYKRLKIHEKPCDSRIEEILYESKTQLGINRNIKVVIQGLTSSPSLISIVKPKILLTNETASLEDSKVEYILLHELAHYKRKDVVVNYILLAIQILHWFNPIIMYLFNCIREDMEVATDAKVISILNSGEHNEYGKTLLTVIERSNSLRGIPKFIGMVDDKKSIKKRIKMITKGEFYKRNKVTFSIVGLGLVILIGVIFLTSGMSRNDNIPIEIKKQAKALSKYKTPYVGDNGKVIGIIDRLSYSKNRRDIELKTEKIPYEVIINYDFEGSSIPEATLKNYMRNDSAIMFALIDNLDKIICKINNVNDYKTVTEFSFTRNKVQESFQKDLREYGEDKEGMENLLDNLNFNLILYPEKYAVTMSSSPGIRIEVRAANLEKWNKISYKTEEGGFIIWDEKTGNLKNLGREAEVEGVLGYSAYWNPYMENNKVSEKKENIVTISLLKENGEIFREKSIKIYYENGIYSIGEGITDKNKIEVYRKSEETGLEEHIFTLEDQKRINTIKDAVSNSKKLIKANKDEIWDYTFNIIDKDKRENIRVQINIDNEVLRYENDPNTHYWIREIDIENIRNLFRVEFENNGVIEKHVWKGSIKKIEEKSQSKNEYTSVELKTENGSVSFGIKSEELKKYDVKIGDYIEVYAESGPQWFTIRKISKVTEKR